MNLAEKQALVDILRLFQREKHRKTMKSARNRRYYQSHKDKILAKQKLKNAIFKKVMSNS